MDIQTQIRTNLSRVLADNFSEALGTVEIAGYIELEMDFSSKNAGNRVRGKI
jgi:hypothetical protein